MLFVCRRGPSSERHQPRTRTAIRATRSPSVRTVASAGRQFEWFVEIDALSRPILTFVLIAKLETLANLIELSRNETHLIFEHDYPQFAHLYRSAIDALFNSLLTLSYRTYQHAIKPHVEELFRQILRRSLVSSSRKEVFTCLWKYHPFDHRPNLLVKQLETNLGKLFLLSELFKLSIELVQSTSTV